MNDKNVFFVIGYPVKHSLSPEIHKKLAIKYSKNISFKALEIKPGNLSSTIATLKTHKNIKGLSITVPFKEKMFKLCDTYDDNAKISQTVSNVIFTKDNKMHGINLDGYGLVADLSKQTGDLKGKSILIIGAGGATKGCLPSLSKIQGVDITLTNRSPQKAIILAELYKNVEYCDINNVNKQFDIIINATSASLNGVLPFSNEKVLSSKSIGYDLAYGKEETVFTSWVKSFGNDCFDGKGMLDCLSLKAFEIWNL